MIKILNTYPFNGSPNLERFFKSVSTNGILDLDKFMQAVRKRFGTISDRMMMILAQFFDIKTRQFDYRGYCSLMQMVLNQSPDIAKAKFFQVLDLGEDRKVCEKDLWEFFLKLEDQEMTVKLIPDLRKVKEQIKAVKERVGKGDEVQAKLAKLNANVADAVSTNSIIKKPDPKMKVLEFVEDVEVLKKKIEEEEDEEMDDVQKR